jgi:hypothetical protein
MASVPVAGRSVSSRARLPRRGLSPAGAGRAPAREGGCAAERLLGYYALEAYLYQSLLAATEEQGELLEGRGSSEDDGLGALAALFAQKDQLLDRIARLEEKAAPLKESWRSEPVPPARRQRLNSLLDGILSTIDAIVEQEQQNEQLLTERSASRHAPRAAEDMFPLVAVS